MPAFSSPALCALLALLILGSTARAFYMPPAFDVEAVPGYTTTTTNSSSSSASESDTATPQSGMSTDGAFDFRNHTAWARDARKAQDAGPAHETRTGLEDEQALEPKPTVASHTPAVGPRDVWSPRITAPDRATVWKVGETVTVRWDASHPPKRVTNSGGKLVLGHFDDGEETNEHLNYEHPLADGFDLSRGQVQLKVPNVKPSNNYIVVLFGDSGNHSPQFTIVD